MNQNLDTTITETTREAFEKLSNTEAPSPPVLKTALNILMKLRGIGPATASLLLSTYSPDHIPFFSDELFRWCFYEGAADGTGWDRPIKYTVKQYLDLFEKVQELLSTMRSRFQRPLAAVDLEKVAYVLGKRARDGLSSDEMENKPLEKSERPNRGIDAPPGRTTKKRRRRSSPLPSQSSENAQTSAATVTARETAASRRPKRRR